MVCVLFGKYLSVTKIICRIVFVIVGIGNVYLFVLLFIFIYFSLFFLTSPVFVCLCYVFCLFVVVFSSGKLASFFEYTCRRYQIMVAPPFYNRPTEIPTATIYVNSFHRMRCKMGEQL